jgi:hypothetical protein
VHAAFGGGALRVRDLVWLAILAGLAINTRASIGVALYLGTTLLVAWAAWKCRAVGRSEQLSTAYAGGTPTAIRTMTSDPSIGLPVAVLLLFAIAVGAVNFARWGQSLHPCRLSILLLGFEASKLSWDPAKLRRNQSRPNVDRRVVLCDWHSIPAEGSASVRRVVDSRIAAIEAPPFSPFFTNPLTIFLAGIGVHHLWLRPSLPPQNLAVLRLALVVHSSAALLILAAMYLTMRYRFDFAPFMTMAALIGYGAISFTAAERPESWRNRLRIAAVGLCMLGILGSHYVLLIHKVWSIAVPMPVRLALLPFAPFARAAFEP